jgi:hypothetical protein
MGTVRKVEVKGGTFAIPLIGAHPERVAKMMFCITSMHSQFQWSRFGETVRRPLLGEYALISTSAETLGQRLRAVSGLHMTQAAIDGKRSFPGASLSIFPKAGHWPMIERLDDWLRELTGFLT